MEKYYFTMVLTCLVISLRGQYWCVIMMPMAQSVMTTGMSWRPELSASNLDITYHQTVSVLSEYAYDIKRQHAYYI